MASESVIASASASVSASRIGDRIRTDSDRIRVDRIGDRIQISDRHRHRHRHCHRHRHRLDEVEVEEQASQRQAVVDEGHHADLLEEQEKDADAQIGADRSEGDSEEKFAPLDGGIVLDQFQGLVATGHEDGRDREEKRDASGGRATGGQEEGGGHRYSGS